MYLLQCFYLCLACYSVSFRSQIIKMAKFTPSFWRGSCCLFFSFLCCVMCTICLFVCLSFLFLAMALSVVSWFSIYEFDCPSGIFRPSFKRQSQIKPGKTWKFCSTSFFWKRSFCIVCTLFCLEMIFLSLHSPVWCSLRLPFICYHLSCNDCPFNLFWEVWWIS